MSRGTWMLGLALMLTGTSAAWADIVPIAALRQVASSGTINTVDETLNHYDIESVDHFDVFDDSSGLALRTEFGTATADGFAKHVSSLGADEMLVFVTSDAFVSAPNENDTAYAGASSRFSLRFLVDAPGRYKLTATGYASNNGTALLQMSDADENLLAYYDALDASAFELELHLPAGEYGMSANADSGGYWEFGSGEPDGRSGLEVALVQVPEPATLGLGLFAGLAMASIAALKRTRS
ncbi:MAG: hypothetical protein SGJ19_17620 [Planctomycetia bacterium]|nr:hypothetical protein [Planctomycetia bacterium]